jgi:FtsP/CotA-like multicopper oxidase with cupredoxin domain
MCCYISYRFRLVSISCDAGFQFTIDGHEMTVIEVEGTNVQPLLVDGIFLFAGARLSKPVICFINQCQTGQRYSVVVRRSYSPFAQDGVLDMFVGHCEPASCQLLYVLCVLSIISRPN